MNGIILKDFELSASTALDATASITTDSIEISRSYEIGFQWVKSGTDGNPIITIEVSNDDVNFANPYLSADGITPLTFTIDAVNKVAFDSIIPFKYVRLSSVANGTTTGTYACKISLPVDA